MFTLLKYDHDLISTIKLNNENNATHATYFIPDWFLVPFFSFFVFVFINVNNVETLQK